MFMRRILGSVCSAALLPSLSGTASAQANTAFWQDADEYNDWIVSNAKPRDCIALSISKDFFQRQVGITRSEKGYTLLFSTYYKQPWFTDKPSDKFDITLTLPDGAGGGVERKFSAPFYPRPVAGTAETHEQILYITYITAGWAKLFGSATSIQFKSVDGKFEESFILRGSFAKTAVQKLDECWGQ